MRLDYFCSEFSSKITLHQTCQFQNSIEKFETHIEILVEDIINLINVSLAIL